MNVDSFFTASYSTEPVVSMLPIHFLLSSIFCISVDLLTVFVYVFCLVMPWHYHQSRK